MKRALQRRPKAQGQIRIIAGQWRGRKLPVLSREGLRPTTDRTKETLFNWLMPYISGRQCLDAFAGTGGLGLEALSRYADSADFVEQDNGAVTMLKDNLRRLAVQPTKAAVHQGNILHVLPALKGPYSLVFLDPPFNQGLLQPTIDSLVDTQKLTSDALIYLEMEKGAALRVPANWRLLKQKQSTQVDYRLYEQHKEAGDGEA
ncbi:16S rRNA (guanine(966)-N(2))-methyltransferase RsmD [Lacimicrobium sp. SS2-24]|uniref:16S rRNA (guanine(966)-N(2))-methyltransferase RsmD n=1 Tax=Lacimicrobium sp. SS2-24 TaxID=2005569 RepID=UPI000B4B2253|nr:16S rRNA (guanine(966)-N(2))-methyltransferase RsmD [Lacimicrobium sp. SS2-24]